MKKLASFTILLYCLCLIGNVFALSNSFIIADFERIVPSFNAQWKVFGGVEAQIKATPRMVSDTKTVLGKVGFRSLQLSGRAKDWVVGAVECQIASDLAPYSHLRLFVFGRNNTRARVDLVIIDKKVEYKYSVYVTWNGWKQISVPLSKFKDRQNRKIAINNKSVRHLKLVLLNDNKIGPVSIALDNIELVVLRKNRR